MPQPIGRGTLLCVALCTILGSLLPAALRGWRGFSHLLAVVRVYQRWWWVAPPVGGATMGGHFRMYLATRSASASALTSTIAPRPPPLGIIIPSLSVRVAKTAAPYSLPSSAPVMWSE